MKQPFSYRVTLIAYFFAAFLLFLYSFTQVDLNLTLSKAGIIQTVQKSFQYIGYFVRPVSAILFLGVLGIFFGLYAWIIHQARKGELTKRQIWGIVGVVFVVLILSYPAFSYDIFNYMFTAKTVLVYHKNPYTVIPLSFAGFEPWLSFMRWTHLPSAYAPAWILLTLPAYILGFGYLLPVLWNIKILVGLFYLLSVYILSKILQHKDDHLSVTGMAIYALNPLVIIECLVSAHNDVVMMALALLGLYLFYKKRVFSSILTLAVSVAMKLMSVTLYPVYFFRGSRVLSLFFMLAALLAVVSQREILAWYWVWIMPFIALLPRYRTLTIFGAAVSLGLLLRYAPYLYYGNWDAPVPAIKSWVTLIPLFLCLLYVFAKYHILHKKSIR
jgi:hypothetical protein